MRSKGFTLIELLAVIVILAIIALIATPIVLGIIEDSRQSSNKLSAEYIVDTVEKSYSMAYTKKGGLVPTLEEVKAEFDMSNASWVTTEDGDTITTTGGEVTCQIVTDASKVQLSVLCDTFDPDIKSGTMEISANTVDQSQPEN